MNSRDAMYKDEEASDTDTHGVDENVFAAEERAARRRGVAQVAEELGAIASCLHIIADLVSARAGGNALTTLADDLQNARDVLEEWERENHEWE